MRICQHTLEGAYLTSLIIDLHLQCMDVFGSFLILESLMLTRAELDEILNYLKNIAKYTSYDIELEKREICVKLIQREINLKEIEKRPNG